MLDPNMKAQLKAYLGKLVLPIELLASLDESAKSRELWALLKDLAELSPLISISRSGNAARRPSFAIRRVDSDLAVEFAGIPLGHEFTSLVLALLQVGGHPPKISAEQVKQIAALEGNYQFETYYSLSCQNCPDVVQALNTMSVLSQRIRHTAIDGALNQAEVEQRQIMAVPSIYLNGELFGQGRMSLEQILAKLDTGAASRAAAALKQKDVFDMLVVGGGPAGAAAAIYSARKGISTGIICERFGGQVMDTMGIENFISVVETEGPKLASALAQHVRSYEVDIMDMQQANGLRRSDDLIEIDLASGATLKARSVVLASGARWRQMNVPGEEQYRNKGVAYCPHCDGPLFKGKRVAVIGGGNSGVEAAIDLAGIVSQVTLIEFDSQLRADEVLQRKLRSLPNVRVITSAQTTEVHGDGSRVNRLSYKDRNSGELKQIELEGIFVQIGLLPNTEWLKDSLQLSARGEIVIDDRNQTSMPGVFAAGDATTVPFKQIIIAMGEGSKASLSAFDYLIRHSTSEQALAPAELAQAA